MKKKRKQPRKAPPAELPKIDLTASPVPRSKSFVVEASRDGEPFHRDELNLNSALARRRFATAVGSRAAADEDTQTAIAAAVDLDLQKLARVPPGGSVEEAGPEVTAGGYAVVEGETWLATGGRPMRLANFVARIVAQTVVDDGVAQDRELTVTAERAGSAPVTVGVPVKDFSAMDWVLERLGPGYVIQAGAGARDHVRCAIQELTGGDPPQKVVYRHTGWREVGGRWRYLHAGLDGTGPDGIAVQLRGPAARFVLPPAPSGDELRGAVRASLGLLHGLAPDRIAVPLLASVYRAPLGPADFGLWLDGPTGTFKSELAALAQQHFGAAMTRTQLPANWASTANATEELAFELKDALLVIDDFAPPASKHDADRLHQAADRLVRGAGNGAGRQRMNAACEVRAPRPARCLVLGTGEDLPRIHSLRSRLAITDVRPGDVNRARLSGCQADAASGAYAAAMSGYVAWLAERHSDVMAEVAELRVALRDQLANGIGHNGHAREPEVGANILLGMHFLLRFAKDVGALTQGEVTALWNRVQRAVDEVAAIQGDRQRDSDPVDRFPALLSAVISSGLGHVADHRGDPPDNLATWGWDAQRRTGKGLKIGWLRRGELLLDQDTTYAALTDLVRRKGEALPLSAGTFFRRLKERGVLARCDEERTTTRHMLEGSRRHVSVVPVEVLGREREALSVYTHDESNEAA